MGRELRPVNEEHVSPITGVVSQTNLEKNKLHAHVDDLWVRADEARRQVLESLHASIERAHDLGSKAKSPSALTHEDATAAVVLTYEVAHAICFAGGFPARESAGG